MALSCGIKEQNLRKMFPSKRHLIMNWIKHNEDRDLKKKTFNNGRYWNY